MTEQPLDYQELLDIVDEMHKARASFSTLLHHAKKLSARAGEVAIEKNNKKLKARVEAYAARRRGDLKRVVHETHNPAVIMELNTNEKAFFDLIDELSNEDS